MIVDRARVEQYCRNHVELASLLRQLPSHVRARAEQLLEDMSAYAEDLGEEHAVTSIWAGKNACTLRQQANTHLDILMKVLAICRENHKTKEKVLPHVRTLKRFRDEHKEAEFSLEDARAEVRQMLADKGAL